MTSQPPEPPLTARAARVVIADDHPVFRRGLARLLRTDAGLDLVAEAGDGAAAVDAVRANRPAIAVLDLQMPVMTGLEAALAIARELPDVGILVLTMSEDDATVWAALRAGARGYVLKTAAEDAILRAVHAVAEGELVVGIGVAQRMRGFFDRPLPSAAEAAFPDLTARERAVLEQLAAGASNSVIATRLGLTPKTVRNYVSAILVKLQVPDRAAAAERARGAGIARSGIGR
jgi:DNA-binding NarL/FixJ family response regulator